MQNYLGFTVIAAIVTTCGTLLGLYLKEYVFVRHFDNFRDKKSLELILKKYQDPIILSAHELLRRTTELRKDFNKISVRYTRDNLFNEVEYLTANDSRDPYFLKYRFISTIYRFCAFWGWIEMYRQDTTFLNSHSKTQSFELLELINKIQIPIADGHIKKEEQKELHDILIFREELRAVGEGMIVIEKDRKSIMGYGSFQMLIRGFKTNKEPVWIRPVINFFSDLQKENDFRVERFHLLSENLIELLQFLDGEYYKARIKNWVN